MIWWNISTWKCETAEPQAVWMFVSFFFFFCSALNFCHQCLSCFVFCFRLYSFWFLFVLSFFVPWLFCKSVILPMIKFRLWVVPAHKELCRSNVVFSLCSSSYTYLNMSSMCVHFGGFFVLLVFVFSSPCSSDCSKPEMSSVVQWKLFPFALFLALAPPRRLVFCCIDYNGWHDDLSEQQNDLS